MKKLKLEIPEGYKIINFDLETGVATIERKQIETIEDAVEYIGEDDEDVKEFRSLKPNTKSYNYLALVNVIKALNDSWIADWTNVNEKKWVLWFYLGDNFGLNICYWSHSSSFSFAPASLVFKSEAIAHYAHKTFLELFKKVHN